MFRLSHDALDLDVPFTSFIDVSFRGIIHQAFVAADRHAFTYTNVTGEFSVGEYQGHVLEMLDEVETQVSHRYQGLVTTPQGVLSTHSYDSVPGLLAFIGSLRPQATSLGVVLNPDDECEYASPAKVALQLPIGLVELTPLTQEVLDTLPEWEGTSVEGGELFGGRFADGSAYLTLVTDTCRVMVMPSAASDADEVTTERVPAAVFVAIETALAVTLAVLVIANNRTRIPLSLIAAVIGLGFVAWIARLLAQDSTLPCACSFSAAPTSRWSLLRAALVVPVGLLALDLPDLSAVESCAHLLVGLATAAAIYVLPEALGWPEASRALMQRVEAFSEPA